MHHRSRSSPLGLKGSVANAVPHARGSQAVRPAGKKRETMGGMYYVTTPAHLPACVSRRGRHSLPSPADLTACQCLRTNCRTGSVDMEGPFGRDPARSPLRFHPQSNPSGLRGSVDNALTAAIQPVRDEGLGSQCITGRDPAR